ncbi:gliding motility-associated C-terminal domain-containing protein [Spirosoma montaniterrae]|uniref:PKD domain-containing protein n=1 Tax=Spirosoma montaniterrae TaxID=1178516 RepID=A0A1P9WRQ3_9BACT|nr:gliding motility-associated C-terminal domain-containing protein [Spirosoma montaniterrae]AQG78044.1 hypothetical protein AWR27_00970 [Spirosoma montaniterrae]
MLPLEPLKFTAKACSGRVATLDVTLDANTGQYDSFIVRWGEGLPQVITRANINQASYTYTRTGNFTIEIQGQYAGQNATDCITPISKATITVSQANSQPSITRLTTTSDNSISIQYQASPGSTVQLHQKGTDGVYAPTGQTSTGAPFVVQTNAKQVQCFQVVAQDACNNAGQRSDEVCSLVINAQAVNKQNNLSWQPYAGTVSGTRPFRFYRLTRNGSPTGGTITNRNTGSSTDLNVQCGVQYCYAIEATIDGTNGLPQTVVASGPSCVTGINGETPGSFRNTTVSIENGRPRLQAGLPLTGTSTSFTLVINRSSGSGPAETIGTVTNRNTFIDESADPNAGSYCYTLTYINSCGLSSPPSAPVCTIHLSSKSNGSIDWTAESPFLPGPVAEYTVEVIDSVNNTKRDIRVGGNTRYEPDPNDPNLQQQKYRIVATTSTGAVSYSNFFTFRREASIFVPDAFTPNGDGMNDEFLAKGIYVDAFRMTIFDRWGTVVYSTPYKTKGWDGTINGQIAMPGQYMYRIEIEDLTGQKTVRTGGVLLIR